MHPTSSRTHLCRWQVYRVANNLNYHLSQSGRANDCQAKGRRFNAQFQVSSYLLAVVRIPGQESLGRSKTGEESQEVQMKTNSSLYVSVQSAKSGCKSDGKEHFLRYPLEDLHVSPDAPNKYKNKSLQVASGRKIPLAELIAKRSDLQRATTATVQGSIIWQ